jgi:hypothetical protein
MDNDYYQPISSGQQPAVSSGQQPTDDGLQPAVSSVQDEQGISQQPAAGSGQQPAGSGQNDMNTQPQTADSKPPAPSDTSVPNTPIGLSKENSTPPTAEPVLDTPTASPPATPVQSDEQEAKDLVRDAVEQIVSDMGYDEASDEQKKQLFETIEKRVSLAILKALMANIAPDEAQILAGKIESGESIEQDIEKIVKDNPQANEAVAKAIADLYEKMLQESKDVWDAMGKNE